jgi:hypothetical protein
MYGETVGHTKGNFKELRYMRNTHRLQILPASYGMTANSKLSILQGKDKHFAPVTH